MIDALQQYRQEFSGRLASLSKDETLEYALTLLSEGRVTVRELYEEIIAPALNGIQVNRENADQEIWKEHLVTNIARSIVECAHPYVAKAGAGAAAGVGRKRVVVLCPEEEYHELGARMGADFFTMAGFDVTFVGANTPRGNFLSAYNAIRPDVIAISVTNYLNLVSLKKIVVDLRAVIDKTVLIVVSGSALKHACKTAKDFGADRIISTFDDVKALGEAKT